MAVAVYPGSFDPITYGHMDIIERASKLFDKLIIGVLVNQAKTPFLSTEERVELIKEVTRDIPNVEVVSFSGLLVDLVKREKADVIIRGLRAVSDFEYEMMMAQTNRQLDHDVDTLFFATDEKHSFISSSSVRELVAFGGEIDAFVSPFVKAKILEKKYR